MREIDWTLLDRYLAGECTAADRARVDAWLAEAPEHRTLLDMLQQTTSNPPVELIAATDDKADVWMRLERQLAADGVAPLLPLQVERPARRVPRTFPVSASRAVFAQAAVLAAVLLSGVVAAGVLLRRETSPAQGSSAAMHRLNTPNGQRAMFQLPDGSRVVLGVASTLRYPPDYNARRREVHLEGEAYFQVRHDEARPFIVRAGDLVAQDLGTEFTVRAYPEDRHARVVVREGEVGVRAATSPDATVRVLVPGQLGRLGSSGTPIVEAVQVEPYFAWTQGVLVLQDTPLRDALPQLSRWFDLEFQLGDTTLGNIPVTATLRTTSVPDLIENLAAALPVRPVRRGRTVTLYAATIRSSKR